MTIIYSTIGIIIFSTIFLINKYTLLFSDNNFIYKESSYVNSQSQQVDKFFLELIKSGKSFGQGENICRNLKFEYEKSGLFDSIYSEYILDGLNK